MRRSNSGGSENRSGAIKPMRKGTRSLLLSAVSDGVPWSALKVAVAVGTVLNVINQGDAFLGSVPISWPKIVLTYLVPYAVFTFGVVSAKAKQLTADRLNNPDGGR
jgi:hypothetical protein